MTTMMNKGHSARALLLALGMGDYNATMAIPYMFMAPAQTDPQMAQIILVTRHLQRRLLQLGKCALPISGSIDGSWAACFRQVVGPNWLDTPWCEIIRSVLAAKRGDTGMVATSENAAEGLGGLSDTVLSVATLGLWGMVVPSNDPSVAGVNLNATANGDGTITMDDFVSKNGNCKPKNLVAMNHVKSLQLQLNRVAGKKGFSTVDPDGDVGSGTLALHQKVQTAQFNDIGAHQIMGDTSNCLYIAGDADVLAGQVKSYADSLGAPTPSPLTVASVAKKGTMAVTSPVTNDVKFVKPPGATAGLMDIFHAMSTPQKIVFTGLMGGIGFLVVRKIRKGKKGSSRRARA